MRDRLFRGRRLEARHLLDGILDLYCERERLSVRRMEVTDAKRDRRNRLVTGQFLIPLIREADERGPPLAIVYLNVEGLRRTIAQEPVSARI